MKYHKLILKEPVKLNRNQLNDITEKGIVWTDSKWLVVEIQAEWFDSMAILLDTLYCYEDSNKHFNHKWNFVESQWVNPNCDI